MKKVFEHENKTKMPKLIKSNNSWCNGHQ